MAEAWQSEQSVLMLNHRNTNHTQRGNHTSIGGFDQFIRIAQAGQFIAFGVDRGVIITYQCEPDAIFVAQRRCDHVGVVTGAQPTQKGMQRICLFETA